MPTISFDCPQCGERHDGSPSFAFDAPCFWKPELAGDPKSKLDDNTCIVGGQHYFLRCILEVPIMGEEEPFLWGVWLSQSMQNFHAYREGVGRPGDVTVGYLANQVPGYSDTVNMVCKAHWQKEGLRPLLEPKPSDHRLYLDWKEGIAWERAEELALPLLKKRMH